MARVEIVKKGNYVISNQRHATTNARFIEKVRDAKLTAKVLLKKGLSKIHKPPFKDFSREFQDDVK